MSFVEHPQPTLIPDQWLLPDTFNPGNSNMPNPDQFARPKTPERWPNGLLSGGGICKFEYDGYNTAHLHAVAAAEGTTIRIAGVTAIALALDALGIPHSRRTLLQAGGLVALVALAATCAPPTPPLPIPGPEPPRPPEPELEKPPLEIINNRTGDRISIMADRQDLVGINRQQLGTMIEQLMKEKLAVNQVTVHLSAADFLFVHPDTEAAIPISEDMYQQMTPADKANISDGTTHTVYDNTSGKPIQVDIYIALGQYRKWQKMRMLAKLTNTFTRETINATPELAANSILYHELHHAAQRTESYRKKTDEETPKEEKKAQQAQFDWLRQFINREVTANNLLFSLEKQPSAAWEPSSVEMLAWYLNKETSEPLTDEEIDLLLLGIYELAKESPCSTTDKDFADYHQSFDIQKTYGSDHTSHHTIDFSTEKRRTTLGLSQHRPETQAHMLAITFYTHILSQKTKRTTLLSDSILSSLSIQRLSEDGSPLPEKYFPVEVYGFIVNAQPRDDPENASSFNHAFDLLSAFILTLDDWGHLIDDKHFNWLQPGYNFATKTSFAALASKIRAEMAKVGILPKEFCQLYFSGDLAGLIEQITDYYCPPSTCDQNNRQQTYAEVFDWMLEFTNRMNAAPKPPPETNQGAQQPTIPSQLGFSLPLIWS